MVWAKWKNPPYNMKETITSSSQDSRLFSKLKLSCVSKKFNEREVTLKKAWHTKVNPNTSPNISLCTRSLKVHARISTFFMHGIIEKSNTHSSVYLNRSLSTIESIFTKNRAEFQVQIFNLKNATLLLVKLSKTDFNRFVTPFQIIYISSVSPELLHYLALNGACLSYIRHF